MAWRSHHAELCATCHRRPRVTDSVLCVVCGYPTMEASLAHLEMRAGMALVTSLARSAR